MTSVLFQPWLRVTTAFVMPRRLKLCHSPNAPTMNEQRLSSSHGKNVTLSDHMCSLVYSAFIP